jgi:hypothetical protein
MSEQKRLKTYAIIDDRFTPDIVARYFDVKWMFRHKLVKRIVFKFNRLPVINQEGPEEAEPFFAENVRNWRYYYAYFQSEVYFSQVKDQIKRRFRVKEPFVQEFKKKYRDLFDGKKKVLAIHYRFGDYVDWGKDELGGINLVLPESYYINALSQIPDLEDYQIILVTDDVKTCDSRTFYIKNKKIFSDSEIMDFQLLQHADKLIVANSTFSWWAAYLNKKNAEVLAPEFWLGFKVRREFPNGIIPGRYQKVKF